MVTTHVPKGILSCSVMLVGLSIHSILCETNGIQAACGREAPSPGALEKHACFVDGAFPKLLTSSRSVEVTPENGPLLIPWMR